MENVKLKIGSFFAVVMGSLFFMPALVPIRVNKVFVAEWCAIVFIAIMAKNKWLGAFILWCLWSTVASTYTPVVGLNRGFVLGLHTIVIFSFLYYLLFDRINRKTVDIVLDVICIAGILQVLMMLIQYNGMWPGVQPLNALRYKPYAVFIPNPRYLIFFFDRSAHFDCPGFMDMCNTTSGFLALCLPAFFRRQWRWGIPFIFAGLWIARSMGGTVPAVIVTAIYFIAANKKHTRLIVMTMVLFLLAFIKRYEGFSSLATGSGRWDLWQAGFKIYTRQWITGWGIQQSEHLWQISASLMERKAHWVHYHNEFLNLAIELGFVGIVIITGFFSSMFIRIQKHLTDENTLIITLTVLAGLINCLVNFTMHNVIGLILLVNIAMMDKLSRSDHELCNI